MVTARTACQQCGRQTSGVVGSLPGSQILYGAKPIFPRRSFRTPSGLPQSISENGSVLLAGLVIGCVDAIAGPGVLMLVLWV